MSTAVATKKPTQTETPKPESNLPTLQGPRLPYHPVVKDLFGIDRASWKALVEAIFPNATSTESVLLALSYCRGRKLDPFKRVVHIVPIWNKQLGAMIDTVWPGIGELRTTAFRTGEYAGRGETVLGPDVTAKVGKVDMTFPEWGQVTVKRIVKGNLVDFVGPRVYWIETYATVKRDDDTPNEMWSNRPRGQLEKCAEAAALRAAFPEEIGSDYIPEEVQHHSKGAVIDSPSQTKAMQLLDDLTKQLESKGETKPEQNGELSHEPDPSHGEATDGELPSLATLADELAAVEMKSDVTKIRAKYAQLLSEEDQPELARLCDERVEQIQSSRGGRS